jgi:hypothetical protein
VTPYLAVDIATAVRELIVEGRRRESLQGKMRGVILVHCMVEIRG